MQPNDQNSYDFILDPQQQHKHSSGLKLGNGKNRILISVVFLGLIIGIVIIAASLLLSLGKASNGDLIAVRAHQVELSRIITLGQKNISDTTLKNQLASLGATLSSDGIQLAELLKDRGVVITKLELNAQKDSDVDTTLDEAVQDGTYDKVLLDAVTQRSNLYFASLKDALSDATTKTEKSLLQTAITNLETSAQ